MAGLLRLHFVLHAHRNILTLQWSSHDQIHEGCCGSSQLSRFHTPQLQAAGPCAVHGSCRRVNKLSRRCVHAFVLGSECTTLLTLLSTAQVSGLVQVLRPMKLCSGPVCAGWPLPTCCVAVCVSHIQFVLCDFICIQPWLHVAA